MQRPQTESGLPKRSSTPSGDGGLAASIEAAAKQRAPQPSGKGVAMVVLAVLVMAAVVFEVMSTSTPKQAPVVAGDGTDGAGPTAAQPHEAPTVPDPRFDLPGDLPGATGKDLALALTGAASVHGDIRDQSLEALTKAFEQVPEALREDTRARLLAHLATIGDQPKARGPVLQAAARLIDTLPKEQVAATRRLSLLAELSLDDNDAAASALVYLSYLPADVRPSGPIAAIVLDVERPLPLRIAAAHALPAVGRTEAIQALAADASTPRVLREALQ